MNKGYTSLEQSRRLLELGVSSDTADMYYRGTQSIINPKEFEYSEYPLVRGKYVSFDDLKYFYPCWSLNALLNILPHYEINNYSEAIQLSVGRLYAVETEKGETLMDIVVDLITWGLQHGLDIKKVL